MHRDYDHTPASLLGRSREWYDLATQGMDDPRPRFTTAKYVAFCFSIEFLLKALICINKKYATTAEMKKFSHKLNITKNKALEIVNDQTVKNLIVQFFEKYPEFNDRDVIETRYGKVGKIGYYDANSMIDELYLDLMHSADVAIHKEWAWRQQT